MSGKIIAIDGYSSCGKSTFAKLIASYLGYVFIDTGAMYRAITLYSLRQELSPSELINRLDSLNIEFKFNDSLGLSEIFLNGEKVDDDDLRSIEVNESVSKVSKLLEVREKLVEMQRKLADCGGIVMDGRDIGTVVFPDADIKIFMTADVDIRAMRRYKEQGGVVPLHEVARNIKERDYADENREESPLRKAKDAFVMDNSNLTLDQQLDIFKKLFAGVENS